MASGTAQERLLVVILDASDTFTQSTTAEEPLQRLPITQCVDDVTTFVNSYLLLSHDNSIAVCLCHQAGSQLVYPVPGRQELAQDDPRLRTGKYEPLVHINAMLTEEVQRVMTAASASSSEQDSSFLQQASDITGGIYIKVPEPAGLLQFLLWTFLPNVSLREHLTLPPAVQVDYRAACFCHQKLVDVGYVCSVCLSIFCRYTPICLTCQAHFKLPSLPNAAKSVKSRKKKNHKVKQSENSANP